MKKVLTFVLALVMVLALAAPALAFTGKDKDESTNPWKISIQLVDYYSASFTKGFYTQLPAADRGYLYNEMVGAVVSMFVPEGFTDAASSLQIKTENVKVWDVLGEDAKADAALVGGKPSDLKDKEVAINSGGVVDKTFRYLVLGQLTGEAGSITATIKDSTDSKKLPTSSEIQAGTKTAVVIKDYKVSYDDANKEYVMVDAKNIEFRIGVDSDHYCKYMKIGLGADLMSDTTVLLKKGTYKVEILNGDIVFDGGAGNFIRNDATQREAYAELTKIYNNAKNAFGFDRTASGYLYDSFFYGIKGTKGVSATAYLEPYVASITVPDVVVDPPKTGDASTLVGIVMVIAALAGVVVMKKVRA